MSECVVRLCACDSTVVIISLRVYWFSSPVRLFTHVDYYITIDRYYTKAVKNKGIIRSGRVKNTNRG